MRKTNFFLRMAAVVALLTSLFLLGGCCNACRGISRNHKPLTSTEWMVEQMEGKNVASLVAQGEQAPFLTLGNDGSVGGYAGCNRIGGQYRIVPSEAKSQREVAGKMEFGQMLSTKRYCPNDKLERTFLRLLSQVDAFVIEGDYLHLLHNGELVMVLRAK